MRKTGKFTTYVNFGALALLVAAVVALLFTQKNPKGEGRQPASQSTPHP